MKNPIDKFSNGVVISLIFGLLVLFSFSPINAQEYGEAPMLKEKVEAGDLPPVGERLPEDPLVLEPLDEIGSYGGTWNRLATAPNFIHFGNSMDGSNFVRFTDSPGLKKEPNLLKDWEVNEDKSSWVFHFRKGLRWSDGAPCTVNDFLYWWEDLALEGDVSVVPPEWSKAGGELMEVTKVDDYTIKLDFIEPNPFLLDYLSMWANQIPEIQPAHYLKQFDPRYSEEYDDYEILEEKMNASFDWANNPDSPVLTAWKIVRKEEGKRLVLERNPYYYAVDSQGNQLPYLDRVTIRYLADNEIYKLKMASGESDMQIRPKILTPRDVAMLKANESKHNFKTLMWSSGSGTGSSYQLNWNHPDPVKRALYRNSKFKKALSHAIDRSRIHKVIYYGEGFPTTGTYWEKTPYFTRHPDVFEKWRDSAVEYDQEKARQLLDEIGVVDQDGDGWRDKPNGEELKLRIDLDSGAMIEYTDCSEMVKSMWREVGLKTIVNPVDGSQLGVMHTNATFDVRNSWEISDGSSLAGQPEWLIPVANSRWAPLAGAWWTVQGTKQEGTELDKDPRDRTPPREEPEPGSSVKRLQELYKEAKTTPSIEERDPLVRKMIEIHIEDGPFIIGTVADWSRVGIVKDYFKNVPEKLNGGQINDWHLGYPAVLNPDTFYIEK